PSTTATPYNTICGRKIISIGTPAPTISAAVQPSGWAGTSVRMIGSVRNIPATITGTVMTTAQVSRPDAIREACALSPRSTGPDSSGTTTLASAPPATTSNTTFG